MSTESPLKQEQMNPHRRFPAIALAGLFCAAALWLAYTAPPEGTHWLVQFIRLTARISLVWFMVSFAIEPVSKRMARAGFTGFLTVHGIHLITVTIALANDVISVSLGPVLLLLLLGVAALPFVGMHAGGIQILAKTQAGALYFIWFLFAGTYATRLVEPVMRAPHALYVALLATTIIAIGARLVLARRPAST